MNLGRVQQGDWLQIPLVTVTSSGAVGFPTDNTGAIAWPMLSIIDPTKTHQQLVMTDQPLTAINRHDDNLKGRHALWQRIGPEFPVGVYYCYLQWQAGSATMNRRRVYVFQVVAGGDPKGAYTALAYYQQPQASFIVGQTDGGLLEARRNPK
jgi:hypothetical protein